MKNQLGLGLSMMIAFTVAGTARADKACFSVEKMTCAACPLTVKAAAKKVAGVQAAQASLENKSAEVTFDPAKTSVEAVGKAISDVGYPATPKPCKDSKG